jgi:hypothetical protein
VGGARGAPGARAEDPRCGQSLKGCGLAAAELSRPDEPAETQWATAGACLSGDALAIDIDGDGSFESFPIAGMLDGIRAPAAEWTATPTTAATCTPTFQVYDIRLAAEPRKGQGIDPKAVVTVDVMGVVDLDGDGRREVVLAMRFPTVRTIVVYTATASPQRLELAGEATSFQR